MPLTTTVGTSTEDAGWAHGDVGEPEPGWRPGDERLVEPPDAQIVRCRVVNLTDTGTIQVVPEHDVVIGRGATRARRFRLREIPPGT